MSSAWYVLRRTLPLWSYENNLAELLEFCKNNHVDEVVVKVDTEEFTHAIPSLSWLDAYMPILRLVKESLEANGIVFSLNPWVTLVHCDRGRDVKATYPDVDLIVGHDGIQCKACCCPLSQGWRTATKALWNRYASLQPDTIWIEDDIRLLNHQPVDYGCFCELHMAEFSERVGKKVSREELVAALLAPGEPHPYRKVWLDLNRQAVIDTVHFLEECVHEVSPKSKMGLMCSMPNSHAIEGRDWDGTIAVLTGEAQNPIVARPCMCNYEESSPRGLYESEYLFRSTQYCLPKGTIAQTEIDNVPFTLYSKSTAFTYMQCALSFIFGADGVTMNLFDHLGSPMSVAPEFGNMLRDKKTVLNAISDRCKGAKQSGIQILHAKDGTYNVKLEPNAVYSDLSPAGDDWRKVLEPLGFPITFEDSKVVALSGQVVRSLSDAQIKKILSAGALIDLTALKCLVDMGYQELLGVAVKREFLKYDEPIAAEGYFNETFGGFEHCYMTLTVPGLGGDAVMAEFIPAVGAEVVSRMVDPDAKPKYPFLTVYENTLGGRVAVYPVDINYCAGAAFLNQYRKKQLETLLDWLSFDATPLCVSGGAYPLPFRLDKDDLTVVGSFNLSSDAWPTATYDVACNGRVPVKVEVMNDDGTYSSLDWTHTNDRVVVTIKAPQPPFAVTLITIYWNS